MSASTLTPRASVFAGRTCEHRVGQLDGLGGAAGLERGAGRAVGGARLGALRRSGAGEQQRASQRQPQVHGGGNGAGVRAHQEHRRPRR